MDWEQERRAPSRFEADQEARWEWLIESHDERYEAWCRENWLDPEDVGSVLAYEQWWDNPPEEEFSN
jgi:hypothetical protein